MKFIDEAFKATTSSLKKDFLKIFKEQKTHSRTFLKSLKTFPPKTEQWKYTHFSHINDLQYTSKIHQSAHLPMTAKGHHLVFCDGICESPQEQLPKGVSLKSFSQWHLSPLSSAFTSHSKAFMQKEFLEIFFEKESVLEHLNLLLCPDIYLITVAPHTVIDKPLNIHIQNSKQNITGVRLLFDLQEGSHLKVNLHHKDQADSKSSSPPVPDMSLHNLSVVFLRVRLARQAQMDMCCWQRVSSNSTFLTQSCFDLIGQDCVLNDTHVHLGDGLARHNGIVQLKGQGACVQTNAISLLSRQSHFDAHFYIHHLAPQTKSLLQARGVVSENARFVFNGWVGIDQKAQRSDSHQSSKALILSPYGEADVKPELDVFADDVKATHGATVGQVNEDEIFYLQSRGLPYKQALKCLSVSFLQNLLVNIKDKDLKTSLEKELLHIFNTD